MLVTSNEDRVLSCKDCGSEFVFTVGEQDFYRQKGFENTPTRCKSCRDLKKRNAMTMGQTSFRSHAQPTGLTQVRSLHPATCSSCGAQTQVPFRPALGKPVYCRDCYHVRSHRRGADHQPIML
jgi:CxxC-x17-CxxC domain-containing protein